MGAKLTPSKADIGVNNRNTVFVFFIENFKEILADKNPRLEEVEQLFEWLKDEANSATSFCDINSVNYCRRLAEYRFSKSSFKKEIRKKSKEVSHELVRRFDELRTVKKITKGRLAIFQGHKEEEKALPFK